MLCRDAGVFLPVNRFSLRCWTTNTAIAPVLRVFMSKILRWISAQLGAWLDRLSYRIIGPLALLLAAAPVYPEPHLLETSRMLIRGELTEAIYIFDFFMHSSGLVLLGAKIGRDRLRNEDEAIEHITEPALSDDAEPKDRRE